MRDTRTLLAGIAAILMTWPVAAAEKINAVDILEQAAPQLMYSAHGTATDNKGEEFSISQKSIIAAQNRLLAALHSASTKAVAADSVALLQNVYKATEDPAEHFIAKVFLTHFLTKALPAKHKYVLKHVNEKLAYRARLFGKMDPAYIGRLVKIAKATPRNAPPTKEEDDDDDTDTFTMVGEFGPIPDWIIAILFPETGLQTASTGYMNRCVNNGVPLPPDYGSPLWDFIGKGGTGFIYAYAPNEPAGACMALARPFTPGGNNVGQIGIICNGYDSGNACFWDRRVVEYDRFNQPTIRDTIQVNENTGSSPRIVAIDGEFIQGAPDFPDEQCTRCHQGENPYIVEPGGFTDVAGQQASNGKRYETGSAARWYTPLFRGNDWPLNLGPYALRDNNNNGVDDLHEPPPNQIGVDAMTALVFNIPAVVPAQSCITCHNLPAPQPGTATWRVEYCEQVLIGSVSSMPPYTSNTAHWTSRTTAARNAFAIHVNAMHDLCPTVAP